MRIYVACLSSYNNGILYGKWIDASSDVEEMQREIAAMLEASPMPEAEEWAIHDYEDFPNLGEYVGLEAIARIAEFAEEYAYVFGPKDIAAIVDHFGNAEEAASRLEDDFIGHYDNFLEYATEYADEYLLGDMCDEVTYYFDYEAFARDLRMDYKVVNLPSGGVAIFHNG